METLFSVIAALQPQEWIPKIDLKDAYHHVLVHVNIRKYFRFVVAGKVYQFRVLPFGLSTAPREFTKTLAPVIQLLHSQGIQVHAYLDDWIIRATSQEQSQEHTQHIIQLLQSLGWTINWDKSMLQPSRILDFLGLHFILEQALISPPASFLPTLTEVLSRLSPSTVMSARKVSSIISRMSHFAPFISSGRLHLRFLQFSFKQQWTQHQQSWDTPIQLDADFLFYLSWFLRPTVMTGVPLHLPDPSLFFFTDASLKGWGASWKDHQISGPWSPQDSQRHINWLELSCSTSMGSLVETSNCQSLLRQHYGTVQNSGSVCDNSHTHTPPRSQERHSRCSVPSQSTQSNRMAPSNRNLEQTVLCFRNSPDGYVCHSGEQGDARLCFSLPGRQSMGGRCPVPIMGRLGTSVCISTVIMIASQHPSRPWHPLLLQLSTRPRIPLLDIQLFQYVPNIRRPQYHRDPRLLDLAAWNLSGTS